jgi:hypothetical protein
MWSAPDAPNPPVSTYDPDPDLTTLWELWSGNDSCALIEDDHLSASSNMRCVLIQLYFSLCLLSSLPLSVSLSLALYSLSLSFLLKKQLIYLALIPILIWRLFVNYGPLYRVRQKFCKIASDSKNTFKIVKSTSQRVKMIFDRMATNFDQFRDTQSLNRLISVF